MTDVPCDDGGVGLIEFALVDSPGGPNWLEAIEKADVRSLIGAMGHLGRHDLIAYREAAAAMVQKKLAEETVASMRALERAATKLQWVAIVVGVAGLFVGAAGVYVTVLQAFGFGLHRAANHGTSSRAATRSTA